MMRICKAISITIAVVVTLMATSTVQAAPGQGEPVVQPQPTAPEAPLPAVPPPVLPIEVDPANYRMVLAGNIVIGLGGAGLVAMIVGLGIRSDALTQRRALAAAIAPDLEANARQDQRIETSTIVATAGGAAAGALFVAGITLVALGYSRERKRREALNRQGQLAPMLGRQRIGLNWLVRF